ncbi:tumor suppressor candidate 5 homolog [Lingula anatina]|uniref:Tumor suppressor candidate 5 homolog n=1 Tax=Lingula anatina TaxID=7574 RepID=A0A1S3HEB8_LINAN|nr:tumor suppressor candidate 5 homolog [Lingula anatina]|eukprot:XP_013384417.1 tumor suppressor candidate 5 homolog [Lingula anatina]
MSEKQGNYGPQYGQQPPGYYGQQPPPGQQPPGAYYGQQQPPYAVTSQPVSTNMIITQVPDPKPPDYLILSIFVLLCCNLLLGLIALVFSILSQSAYGSGDSESARTHGKVALGLNIAGIVISVVIVVAVLIWYFALLGSVAAATYG